MSQSLVLCFGKVDAALEASKQLSNQVFALDDVPEEAPSGPVLVVGASHQQVSSLSVPHSCPKVLTCEGAVGICALHSSPYRYGEGDVKYISLSWKHGVRSVSKNVHGWDITSVTGGLHAVAGSRRARHKE